VIIARFGDDGNLARKGKVLIEDEANVSRRLGCIE